MELNRERLRVITLHAKELELGKWVYTPVNIEASKETVGVVSSNVTYNEKKTTVEITFPEDLPKGEGISVH